MNKHDSVNIWLKLFKTIFSFEKVEGHQIRFTRKM